MILVPEVCNKKKKYLCYTINIDYRGLGSIKISCKHFNGFRLNSKLSLLIFMGMLYLYLKIILWACYICI